MNEQKINWKQLWCRHVPDSPYSDITKFKHVKSINEEDINKRNIKENSEIIPILGLENKS